MLGEQKGVYEPAKQKGAMGFDEKEPQDEIIDKINEKFKGNFTDGDKVLLTALRDKLMNDQRLSSRRSHLIHKYLQKVFSLKHLMMQHWKVIQNRKIHIPFYLRTEINIMQSWGR